ncbi:MAG TPA: glycosyltransferase family 4 protein, partial [Candidatus Paceibacterota bacterium]|nr:glycosyltransferase family 4 protein [Candidatus Paceibacterota bacterium]
MKKRILIFSLAYYPHVGGAEVAIKEITDRIAPDDIEFHMLTLRFASEPSEEHIGNVHVHRIGNGNSYVSKILFLLQAVREARRLHQAQPFDAWWAMMTYMLFPIVLLRLQGLRTPYLLTLQEGDPFAHVFNRWFIVPFRALLNKGFKEAAAVQAISTYLGAWANKAGYAGEVAVIPNGVDIEHFTHAYSAEECSGMQRALGKKNGDIFMVTTSRLVYKNAIDTVVDALTLLPDNVHFVIYGTGPLESDLKIKTKNARLESRVHFMEYISHTDMPRALAACDIFIRPSRSEGMGNSFLEAMAVGLPVIAT